MSTATLPVRTPTQVQATVRFLLDFQQTLEGELRAGGRLHLEYATERVACRRERLGVPIWKLSEKWPAAPTVLSGRLGAIKRLEANPQGVHREVVHQGRKRRPWLPARSSGDGLDTSGRRDSTSVCGWHGHRALDAMCPPLLSGHYSASSLIWGH